VATLRGRVALVTGAGRGIGRAIAVELASAGVAVGLLSRTESDLNETLAQVEVAGASGIVVPGDLADPASLADAIEQVTGAFGPIDLLVNNGAVVGPLGPTSAVDPDEYAFALAVNVMAPVRLELALVPGMIERGFGRVLNVSTGAVGRQSAGDPYNCYIATKAALEAHTLGLATELAGSGVSANILRPGIVDTSMQTYIRTQDPGAVGEEFIARFVERFESGQLLTPDVPAKIVREILEGEENGQVISTSERLGRTVN
jgi:NAD(P)-dependent dehydrogenase (short-subunit alcohol dehydrogenase family)